MKFMEDNLSMPLSELIPIIQEQIIHNTKYFGIRTLKFPMDFWVYQEIINEVQPDIIIEIGNLFGGSTLALAHILDNLKKDEAKILALDVDHSKLDDKVREHEKINLITGNALSNFEKVKSFIKPEHKVMIIEDSSHFYEMTLKILHLYSPLVTEGSYFIVEDSNLSNGLDMNKLPIMIGSHRVKLEHNGGPYRAINEFIQENDNFVIDRSREKFLLTWNPKGFLKKVK